MAREQRSRNTIRDLARRVAEIAASQEQSVRRKRWRDVNSLRRPDRPPVICHPGKACWAELLPRTELVSQDPFDADFEYGLRMVLYKCDIGDDTVVEPWWPVLASVELEGEHLWGLPVSYIYAGQHRVWHGWGPPEVSEGGWLYDPPIREEADLERIVLPRFRYNAAQTEEDLSRAHGLIGDILPVQVTCAVPGPGAWLHGWASLLCGLEQLMVYMMDRPHWVHRLMAKLRDGFLGVMTQFEEMGILTLNNTGLMACDDLPRPDFDGTRVRLCDLWGRGESQEFQGVSPTHYEEFLLRYQMPILKRWGLSYYGCCENLTRKLHLVLTIPNLRKFICSPWTDLEKMVSAVGDRYTIEWRQKATDVVFAPDMTPIRQHLQRGLQITRQSCLQIVLQELHTVAGRPERLAEWSAAAKELGEKCT
jgi:hypothetical protein